MKIGQKSIVWFLGSMGSSVLAFLATLYFARELGAASLGIFSLIIALASWLRLPTTMGVGQAITKRVSEGTDQDELLTAGGILLLSFGGFVALSTLLLRDVVDGFVGYEATPYLVAIVLLSTILAFSKTGLNGQNLVHVTGVLSPIEIGVQSLLQIALLSVGFGIAGMLGGYLFGSIVALVLGLYVLQFEITRPSRRHFIQLLSYAQFSWLSSVRTKMFNRMDILVLGVFVPSSLIGIYSVSWTLASFLGIFAQAIRMSVFPAVSNISATDGREAVQDLAERSLGYTGLFLIPGLAGGILLGDRILSIYGSEFSKGHHILVILILSYLIHSYGKQFINLLNGIDRPDLAFRISVIYIVVNGLLNAVLIYEFGWVGAAIATLTSSLIGSVVGWRYLTRELTLQAPISMVWDQIVATGCMAVIVLLGLYLHSHFQFAVPNIVLVLSLVSVGAGTYFLVLLSISSPFRATVAENAPAAISDRVFKS